MGAQGGRIGARFPLEAASEVGEAFEVTLGGDPFERAGTFQRTCRVVSFQEEPDGVVCGLAYKLVAGEAP